MPAADAWAQKRAQKAVVGRCTALRSEMNLSPGERVQADLVAGDCRSSPGRAGAPRAGLLAECSRFTDDRLRCRGHVRWRRWRCGGAARLALQWPCRGRAGTPGQRRSRAHDGEMAKAQRQAGQRQLRRRHRRPWSRRSARGPRSVGDVGEAAGSTRIVCAPLLNLAPSRPGSRRHTFTTRPGPARIRDSRTCHAPASLRSRVRMPGSRSRAEQWLPPHPD